MTLLHVSLARHPAGFFSGAEWRVLTFHFQNSMTSQGLAQTNTPGNLATFACEMEKPMIAESIIKPKRPKGSGWQLRHDWKAPPQMAELGYPVEAWLHKTGLFVLSALEVVDGGARSEKLGPEWHLSISQNGGRCDSAAAKWVLGQFGLEDAEEDNHVAGGFVRNFWRPVADNYSGYECPCKDSEPAIKEDKGDFIWRPL